MNFRARDVIIVMIFGNSVDLRSAFGAIPVAFRMRAISGDIAFPANVRKKGQRGLFYKFAQGKSDEQQRTSSGFGGAQSLHTAKEQTFKV